MTGQARTSRCCQGCGRAYGDRGFVAPTHQAGRLPAALSLGRHRRHVLGLVTVKAGFIRVKIMSAGLGPVLASGLGSGLTRAGARVRVEIIWYKRAEHDGKSLEELGSGLGLGLGLNGHQIWWI